MLLTQRASHLKNHPGQISFPGGRMEAMDASPWDTALRETEEEIGLARDHVSLAGYLADHFVISGYLVTPAVAFVRTGFELKLDLTEVEEVFEVPLEFVLDPANHVPRESASAARRSQAFDIPYQRHNIWGATAGMLIRCTGCCARAEPCRSTDCSRSWRGCAIRSAVAPGTAQQTWVSIVPHTIEEAYEIADAVERGDIDQVRDELGDLLFQVVFQSRIAEEQGLFGFDEVVDGDQRQARATPPARVRRCDHWHAARADGRLGRAQGRGAPGEGSGCGVLDGVDSGLPALTRAAKLGRRAAGSGSTGPPRPESRQGRRRGRGVAAGRGSRHDARSPGRKWATCFSASHSSRGISASDPEGALRARGEIRTALPHIEAASRQRADAATASMAELEALWARAKREIG